MSTSFLTAVFLSLLVAIVTGAEIAWAPYDLTAVVKDAENGYCTLEIAWQPGECGLVGTSTVSVIHNGSVHNQTVKTAEGRATFEGCEYWSFYKIVLRAGIACLEEGLHQFVDTGPGQPHRPKEVLVWASSSTANISIVEAPMPRAVSGYNLQLCRVGSEAQNECNPMRFINRTSTEVESYQDRLQDLFFDNFRRYSRNLGVQNTTIHDLVPESTYAYKVIPIIVDGTETYTGSAETGFFKTTAAEPPKIADLRSNYEENNSTLSSVFTWTIVEPEFRVEFYLVSVEPCTEACSVISEEPMAMFSKLEFSKDIRLEITAIFSRGSTRKSASYSFKLRTPEYVEPIKSLEVAKLSPREAILAWPPVGTKSVYVIEVCPVRAAIKECTTQTLVSPKAHLIDDESGVLYDVQIKVRQENFTAEYFQGSLQMLEQDYETPQIVSMDPEEKLWDRVVYGVKASIVAKVSRFEIEACSKNKDLAGCVHSRGASLEDATLPLGYFGTYDVELCAVYELPLDKEVRKCTRAILDTIGTEPDAVQDISFSDVTSDSFHLEWTQPRNVPSRTDGSLEIFYEISTQTINLTSPRPSLEVTGLRAFTDYDIEIRAVVTYQTEQYRGRAAADSVQTDVGTPGLITNLHARQQNYSSLVILEWEDPADANGPLDFFIVEYGLKNPGTHFESVRVNRTRAEISLPVPENDSVYVFRVSAGNVSKRKKKELIGENSELEVNVRGIGLWFNVTVIDVTCNSVELRLNSSNDRKWVSNWFYIIVDSQNRHRNTTLKLVTIHGLETYHNETLRIKACYNDDYCTDELKLVVLTDVSAPSAVTDLKVSVSAGNSGNTLEMKWGEPEIKNGPVDGYVIELTDLTDSEVNMSFTVTDGTSFPFKSADEYETYKLSVRAFNNRVNPPHERVYGPATTKTKRSSGTHVSKVENLTISRVTDTEITVEWDDPIKDNRFNVTLFEVQLFDRNRTSERTQKHAAVIRDLQPYQNVSIGVRSCTGSLTKPDCGLPRMIRSKTDAAAPSPPRNLTVRILDEFTAIASWEAPEFPNGKINNYTLSMKNSTHLLSYYIDGHTLSYKLENLSPSETYVLTLTAGNFNNLSKRLDSKPAKSTFYTGKSSNLGVILMIVAVLATATLLVVGIVGWRSFRRRRLSSPPLIEDDQ